MTDTATQSRPVSLGGTLLGLRQSWLAIDKNARAVAFAQTAAGKAALCLAFVALLALGQQVSTVVVALVTLTLLGCMFFPAHKLAFMAASGTFYFLLRPFRTEQQIALVERVYPMEWAITGLPGVPIYLPMTLLVLVAGYAAVRLVQVRADSWPAKRPVLTLLLLLGTGLAAGMALPAGTAAHGLIWAIQCIFAASFFFLAYMLSEARNKDGITALERTGFIRPFWSGGSMPVKGPSYFRKFEAKTPAELAALHWRGLKLILWATILALALKAGNMLGYDWAGLPNLQQAIAATANGNEPGIAMAWLILFKTFILTALWLAAALHTVVAIIRMCGFGIPRGMARPFSSRTIAEFWNRFFFYFKELLVDFFFYPAFVRFFKKQPKLRIAFATFCAAFVGNVLFSIISQINLFAEKSFVDALWTFDSYVVYALALTIALIVSQLRGHKPRPEMGFIRYQVTPRIAVLGFFIVAQIFSDESAQTTLAERAGFLTYLLGA